MTATDTAVVADRVTDVPKFQVHYRNAGEGHPWFCCTGATPGDQVQSEHRCPADAAEHRRHQPS
jgi:hypothetical protein